MKLGIEASKASFVKPTFKGLALGIALTLLLSIAEPYVFFILHANGFCNDYMTAGALAFLFLLLIIVGTLSKIGRKFNISKPDLITVYTMLIVASAVPAKGPLHGLFSMITGVIYCATPENRWAELIHPHLKNWMFVTDQEAVRIFFEGPSDGKIPWCVWWKPLLSWGMLILAVFSVMIFMMVILRKQWVEREKLLFPLVRLPTEMIRTDDRGGRPFLRNGLMWFGFAIAFVFIWLRGLHFYYPFIPYPKLVYDYFPFKGLAHIQVSLNFAVLGFAYLLSLNISRSMWFFFLLLKAESVVFRILGYDIKGRDFGAGSSLATTLQNGGAMIVLVLFGLWMARGHLKEVFKKAFTGTSKIDDSNELVSYRTAVFGMIFGLAFIAFWLRMSGMPWIVLPVIIGTFFIVFLGLTKIVAQAGVGFMSSGIPPVLLATSSIGTEVFGTQGVIGLGTLWTFAPSGTSVMASTANALKFADEGKLSKRSLLLPIVLAIAITFVSSSWMILKFAYTYSGINVRNFVRWLDWEVTVADKLLNPTTLDIVLQRWLFIGIGGGVMLFLMVMGIRFPWWPLHYIGFPIADTWTMAHVWFTVFVAWLVKTVILKYWGIRGYRAAMPFFFGLVLGQIFGGGVWALVDWITGTVGNFVPVGIDG